VQAPTEAEDQHQASGKGVLHLSSPSRSVEAIYAHRL
jgi:hypothetical protein